MISVSTLLIIALGLILGNIFAEPIFNLLKSFHQGKVSVDQSIASYIGSYAESLSKEQLLFHLIIMMLLLSLFGLIYLRLKRSIEKEETKNETWE